MEKCFADLLGGLEKKVRYRRKEERERDEEEDLNKEGIIKVLGMIKMGKHLV